MQEFYLYLIDGEPVTIHTYAEPLPESMQETLAYWTHRITEPDVLIHLYKTGRNLDEATYKRLNEAAVAFIQRQIALSAGE